MSEDQDIRLTRFMDLVVSRLDHIDENVDTIKRGVYGDPTNGVKGLIQKQEDDHARFERNEGRIAKLEAFKVKATWIWTAFSTSVFLALEFAGDWIKNLFK